MTEASSTYNTAESWRIARDYLSLLGDVPNSFSTTVRTLVQDQERKAGAYSSASRFLVLRLLKGASIKSPLYFASRVFVEEKVSEKPYLKDEDILKFYAPGDLAALLGTIYMYRRAKKICDAEEWGYIAEPLHKRQEVGGHVGFAIPSIGGGVGVITGAMPQMALGCFLKHDKKGYIEYRRHLKKENILLDHEFEMQRWGCTSIQIGSVIVQATGMGIPLANAFSAAFSPGAKVDKASDKQAYSFQVAKFWLDSLLANGKIPEITHDGAYYPATDQRERLLARAEVSRNTQNRVCWLDKGKEDISPELTPQLYPAGASSEVAEEAGSERVSSSFSADELKDLTNEIQDILKE